jgi:hypothetical protein
VTTVRDEARAALAAWEAEGRYKSPEANAANARALRALLDEPVPADEREPIESSGLGPCRCEGCRPSTEQIAALEAARDAGSNQ